MSSQQSPRDQDQSFDYLRFVEAVKGYRMSPEEATERIVRPLAHGAFASVSAMLSHDIPATSLKDASEKLNARSRDRTTRAYNVVLELIENAILALQNTQDAELNVDVSTKGFSVRDNGPGMSSLALFDSLLVPDRSGWVKYGILNETQIYDAEGAGFTAGILWCKKIAVETIAASREQTAIELVVDDANGVTAWKRTCHVTQHVSGTTISVELCRPFRIAMWAEGPASKTKLWQDNDIEEDLCGLVRAYCTFVEPRVKVVLNGERVNHKVKRGFGPEILRLSLDDHYHTQRQVFEIPVYVAQIADDEDHLDHYLGRARNDSFNCILEFYHNGLFLFFRSLPVTNIMSSLSTEKIRNISDFQKMRLNNRILRVFLPGQFPLLLSKLGLPHMAEVRIIHQLLDMVHL